MQCSVFHPGGRECCFALWAIRLLTLSLLVGLRAAEAREPVKVHRIGVLMFTSSSLAIGALQQGLHELGYVEGQNLTLESAPLQGTWSAWTSSQPSSSISR